MTGGPEPSTDPGADGALPVSGTGDPRVDDALIRLQEVEQTPVDEHVAIYDDVHRRLQDALVDLDGG